jgi:anti-repressor protein
MKQLIPLQQHIVGSETIQTVNARELHVFLGVKEDFTHWIKRRISVYQFLEDIDFTKLVVSNAGTISPTEYHISLDMAKQLAMVERTAKGKEARLYFLECERLVMRQQLQPPAIDRYSDLKAIVDLAHSVAEQR